jgi:hypothetical protein
LPDTSDPRRRLYRCLARLTASHPPRGAPAGPRRRPAGHPDHQAHQPPLLRSGGLHSSTTGHRPGPEGIITGGHASKTGRTVAIRYGEAVTTHALIAMFWQVIASDRVGGWRELRAGGRPAVTAYRVDSGPRVAAERVAADPDPAQHQAAADRPGCHADADRVSGSRLSRPPRHIPGKWLACSLSPGRCLPVAGPAYSCGR